MYEGKKRLAFLQVEGGDEFEQALALVNALLLDHDDLCACVYWKVYGTQVPDGLPRLYRFEIAYRAPSGGNKQIAVAEPLETDLWILFPAHILAGEALIETAWQRYITGWREDTALCCEPLDEGLSLLWYELK